jgi:hypothetical protein
LASAREAIKKITKAKKRIGDRKIFQVRKPPISVTSISMALIPNK